MKFKNFLFNPDPAGGGAGGTGGSGTGGASEEKATIEQLQEQLKQFQERENERNQEINSLKSQLGHKTKELEKLQKTGKTQEEVLTMENEQLKKQLEEANNSLKMSALEKKKSELLKQLEIDEQFADLVVLNPEMDENSLTASVQKIAEKQKTFTADLLKKYSTSATAAGGQKNKESNDLVDRILKENENQNNDLTHFFGEGE